MNSELSSPYLTVINSTTKHTPESFKNLEFIKVPVKMGDWFKKTGTIEKDTYQAYQSAIKELEDLGAICTLNSAGRTQFDQVYTKIEKFAGVLKKSKSIKKAFLDTKNLTAKLGYSEHLSNLALDIKIETDNMTVPKKKVNMYPHVKDTGDLKFLTKRLVMEKHGFILSYPISSRLEEVTGIKKPEGWHWRYISPKHSQMIARIRERVTQDSNQKDEKGKLVNQEVFLEDYIKLLNFDVEITTKEELVDKYVALFKTEILGLKNSNIKSI